MKKIKLILAAILVVVFSLCLFTACGDPDPSGNSNVKFTLAFETDGGSAVEPITAKAGASVTLPSTTKDGYHLDGWYKDASYNEQFSATVMPGENVTLYAKWGAHECEEWTTNPDNHWKVCNICRTKFNETAHNFVLQIEGNNHWYECEVCGKTKDNETHTYGEWTVLKEATCGENGEKKHICTVCEKEETEIIPATGKHTYGEWVADETDHWKECSVCDAKTEAAEHSFVNGKCVCGYIDPKYSTPGLEFTISEDKTYCIVSGYSGTDLDVIIPVTYNKLPVKAIGEGAFDTYDYNPPITVKLTGIVIPEGIETIGDFAFCYCIGLTDVSIPSSVTSIGIGAFGFCDLTSVEVSEGNKNYHSEGNCLIETESKTLITGCNTSVIPSDGSVTSIGGGGAFAGCVGLTNITIPDSVISISEAAFSECRGLKSVKIGDGVTSIGDGAFWLCEGLLSVSIGKNVTEIGDVAFRGCWDLSTITVAEGNIKYHSAGNCIIETESKTLFFGCKTSVIPNDGSVTCIGEEAFEYCFNLTNIVIPESIVKISGSAFIFCDALTSIIISDSVEIIGEHAFYGCEKLQTIYCEAESQPIGWDVLWDDLDGMGGKANVVWRYNGK